MICSDRTPAERATFLRGRVHELLRAERSGETEEQICNRLDVLEQQVFEAFQAAENRGEKRGRVQGGALARLTDEEKIALGFKPL